MAKIITLEKSHMVFLKVGGEVCNRLSRGTRVWPIQRNGDWIKITWRNGKKRGWIHGIQEPGKSSGEI